MIRSDRRPFLWLVMTLGLSLSSRSAVAAEATTASAAAGAPRNVVLLISDDHGLDAGCYGSRAVQTPRIDQLASRGVRFTNAYAVVSSCSPSRATLLTGMYNHSNGQYGLAHAAHNQRTRPGVQSLPRVLEEKGYHTGVIGKYHLATKEVYPFDVLKDTNTRSPDALGRETREFLSAGGETPFFLVVGLGDTHRVGPRFPEPDAGQTTAAKASEIKLPAFLPDLPEVRQDYAAYLASVNNLDRCVGAVLDALQESGRRESTLVVFASDNGIPFPGAKTNLYEPAIHLPLIVSAPEAGKAATAAASEALVSWVDIAPTILDWIGLAPARGMQGRSLMPILKDPATPGSDRVFASHTFHEITGYYPMRSLRIGNWKLIRNLAHQLPVPLSDDIKKSPSWLAILASPEKMVGQRTLQQYLHRPEFELYDLSTDPDEFRNLANDPASSETLQRMNRELLKAMRETDDPWLADLAGAEAQGTAVEARPQDRPRPSARKAARQH